MTRHQALSIDASEFVLSLLFYVCSESVGVNLSDIVSSQRQGIGDFGVIGAVCQKPCFEARSLVGASWW